MAQQPEDLTMGLEEQHNGNLVAFEGPADVVSTQLRLLPASSQVLVLPSVGNYMTDIDDARFNARSYIKKVHEAIRTRREAALDFLKDATNDSKRLVFLHGGTAGAVSQCIAAISEHQAAGDVLRAESIFRDIVSEGVNGLDKRETYANQEALELLGSERDREEGLWEDEEEEEDPITKAMRAADVLYNETESLQPIDCYIRSRPRSLSLPTLGYLDSQGEASPIFLFSSPPNEEVQSEFALDDIFASHTRDEANTAIKRTLRDLQGPPKLRISVPDRSTSLFEDVQNARNTDHRATVQLLSPTADSMISPPITPDGVVYGEARMVQMQAGKTKETLRKVRSLDDMDLFQARARRISLQVATSARIAAPADSPVEARSRHLSIVEDPYSINNLVHLPSPRVVKAQTTTIRRSPTFIQGSGKIYVHHGTDPADFDDISDLDAPFEPVLPFHEDLVIHFTNDVPDYILDSVIQSYKDLSYPVTRHSPESFQTAQTDSCPSTPRTADLFDLEDEQVGLSPVAEVPSADEASDYDPYAPRGSDVRIANMASHEPPSPPPVVDACEPPTPAQTPPPHASETPAAKFHDFSTAGRPNAVATQNALRLVLEVYFPSQQQDGGFHQFSFHLLPELDSLWRPIFGESEGHGGKSSEKAADLILAIGSQKSVKREFVSALTGQIEKLGSKSSGMSRSGRLDLRFLIASALQSSSTRSLTHQTFDKLAENHHFLACLLIPHLETYLSCNTSTRFLLLEYPPEHLATVLALQQLVGSDVLKIAGILDVEATSPSSPELPSPLNATAGSLILSNTASASNPSFQSHSPSPVERTLDAMSLPGSPFMLEGAIPALAVRRRHSFSRADYVLASPATDTEIANFISTIWKVLINIDPFYTPEPHPSSRSPKPVTPLISKFTLPHSPPLSPPGAGDDNKTGIGLQPSPRSTAAAQIAASFPYPPPPAPRDDSPSRISVKSSSSGRTRHILATAAAMVPGQQQQRSLSRVMRRGRAGTTSSGYGDDDSLYMTGAAGPDEEVEAYDAEERRLMPMYMRQNEMRKGNSRKALKWLGLA